MIHDLRKGKEKENEKQKQKFDPFDPKPPSLPTDKQKFLLLSPKWEIIKRVIKLTRTATVIISVPQIFWNDFKGIYQKGRKHRLENLS